MILFHTVLLLCAVQISQSSAWLYKISLDFQMSVSCVSDTEIKAKKARLEPESKGVNPLTTVSLDVNDKRAKLRAKIEELQGMLHCINTPMQ